MSLFTLTESAKEQMQKLCKENEVQAVRLNVKGGGCAGFQYKWGFANDISIDDEVVDLENNECHVCSRHNYRLCKGGLGIKFSNQKSKCNFVMWLRRIFCSINYD